ncbi:MAG: deaminase [Candidatus Reddybacter sp.]
MLDLHIKENSKMNHLKALPVLRLFISVFFVFTVSGCANTSSSKYSGAADVEQAVSKETADIILPPGSHPKQTCDTTGPTAYQPSLAEQERDQLYQLVAYGVVYKDWQTKSWSQDDSEPARGYNIGSILVDTSKPLGQQIVCWARNSVITTVNSTQHGEVRLMTNYLSNASVASLKNTFKLYTTLEPCAMCGGMMTLQSLPTTLYGQTDPDFGDGIQRLEVNTHDHGGFCPYPRGVYSNASSLGIRAKIDKAYKSWMKDNQGLTAWLITDEAKELFEESINELNNWQIQHSENTVVLQQALNYLGSEVPSEYTAIPYTAGCSGQ